MAKLRSKFTEQTNGNLRVGQVTSSFEAKIKRARKLTIHFHFHSLPLAGSADWLRVAGVSRARWTGILCSPVVVVGAASGAVVGVACFGQLPASRATGSSGKLARLQSRQTPAGAGRGEQIAYYALDGRFAPCAFAPIWSRPHLSLAGRLAWQAMRIERAATSARTASQRRRRGCVASTASTGATASGQPEPAGFQPVGRPDGASTASSRLGVDRLAGARARAAARQIWPALGPMAERLAGRPVGQISPIGRTEGQQRVRFRARVRRRRL